MSKIIIFILKKGDGWGEVGNFMFLSKYYFDKPTYLMYLYILSPPHPATYAYKHVKKGQTLNTGVGRRLGRTKRIIQGE